MSNVTPIAKHVVMAPDEHELVSLLGACWNLYVLLGTVEPAAKDDLNDFRKAIHDAQRIVMSRAAKRELLAKCPV